MDQKLLFKAFVLSLALMMTACSSSQVDEEGGEESAEVADEGDVSSAEAPTDEVPPEDPVANMDAPPPEDPSAVAAQDPVPAPEAPPMEEAAAAPAPAEEFATDSMAGTADAQSAVPAAPVVESSSNEQPVAASGDASQYTVKSGDTLMKIAFEQYGDIYRWREIFEANRGAIANPNAVPPGTTLNLQGAGMVSIERNGEQYKIKNGDTLGSISNDVYGTPAKWKKLWENNRQMIKNPNKIYAGFYLYYLPEGRLTQDPVSDGPGAQNDAQQPMGGEARVPAEAAPSTGP